MSPDRADLRTLSWWELAHACSRLGLAVNDRVVVEGLCVGTPVTGEAIKPWSAPQEHDLMGEVLGNKPHGDLTGIAGGTHKQGTG